MPRTSSAQKDVKREFKFTKGDFNQIAELIALRTGIVLSENKMNMVYGRIARRLRVLDFNNFKEYLEYLTGPKGEEEAIDFVNAVTTNLTKFFREDHHFEHLGKKVLTPLIERKGLGKKLRIWSAGCSSGMEAYSIAMTIQNSMPNIKSWDIKILATDIDTNMLQAGREGIYKYTDFENIPKALQLKYTEKYDDSMGIVDKSLRRMVHFKSLNFQDEIWPMQGQFDVIFCRNVLIYFDKATHVKLFKKFHALLNPGGWLYLGHSESLQEMQDKFDPQGRTIFAKI